MIRNFETRGSRMVYWTVMITDLVMMVVIILLYIRGNSAEVPIKFIENNDIAVYIAILSGMFSELMFGPLIHARRVKSSKVVERIFKLCAVNSIFLGVLAKVYSDYGGGIVHFVIEYNAILFCTLLLMRFLERGLLVILRRFGHNHHRVVFIGSDPANANIFLDLMQDPSTGYEFVGYYGNNNLDAVDDKLKKLGTRDELIQSLKNGEKPIDVDEVYCSLSHRYSDDINEIMKYCDRNVIRFFFVPRIYGNIQLNLTPTNFGNYTLFTNHDSPLNRLDNKIIKRLFDVCFSFIVCIVLLPFIPVIYLIIRCQSPGPLYFGQKRTGINGQTFTCWKFRSMHVNADSDVLQATKDDPRKFPFGRFMRMTNIDELPQFFNVLKGDMSIVGPRPHMLYHTDVYSNLIDKYMVRHFSKPGITGLAQVSGFRGETKDLWEMEERIKRDIMYHDNWTFLLDIQIILKTIWVVFFPDKKAY